MTDTDWRAAVVRTHKELSGVRPTPEAADDARRQLRRAAKAHQRAVAAEKARHEDLMQAIVAARLMDVPQSEVADLVGRKREQIRRIERVAGIEPDHH